MKTQDISIPKQEVVPLSGGWFMVRHITKEMCSLMWSLMDENQKEEVFALYGRNEEAAMNGMWHECSTSDHQAAFFDGPTLVFVAWSANTPIIGLGETRVMGCFANTGYAKRMTRSFVKKTPECFDAFMLDEPPDVKEIHVFIAKGFVQSRKWAVMYAGMEKLCDAHFDEHEFVCYRRKIGG